MSIPVHTCFCCLAILEWILDMLSSQGLRAVSGNRVHPRPATGPLNCFQKLQPASPKEGTRLALSHSGLYRQEAEGPHIYARRRKASCCRDTWAPKLVRIERGRSQNKTIEEKECDKKAKLAPGGRGPKPLGLLSHFTVGQVPSLPWPPSVLTGRCTHTSPCMCCAPAGGCSGSCRAQSYQIYQEREVQGQGP